MPTMIYGYQAQWHIIRSNYCTMKRQINKYIATTLAAICSWYTGT